MTLFALTEMETHLITQHQVTAQQLARHRELAKAKGFDYADFLETNHKVMHSISREPLDHHE